MSFFFKFSVDSDIQKRNNLLGFISSKIYGWLERHLGIKRGLINMSQKESIDTRKLIKLFEPKPWIKDTVMLLDSIKTGKWKLGIFCPYMVAVLCSQSDLALVKVEGSRRSQVLTEIAQGTGHNFRFLMKNFNYYSVKYV